MDAEQITIEDFSKIRGHTGGRPSPERKFILEMVAGTAVILEHQEKTHCCDFCKKYKLTPQSMALHKPHCTANPDRICRMSGCRPNSPCPLCEFAEDRQSGWSLGTWMLKDRNLKEELKAWHERIHPMEM